MIKGKIVFVGGIHGSGKGTFCKEVINKLDFKHLSASEVLKWEDISDIKNKKVENFNTTQDRLINNLKKIIKPNQKYLLDGHFTLLNSSNRPEKIDINTFIDINPLSIVLIRCAPETISKRLNKRDESIYKVELLKEMQNLEIEHAKHVSKELNIPLYIFEGDTERILKYLKDIK